jgi:hypothetical protein
MSHNDKNAQHINWRAYWTMSYLPHSFAEYYEQFGHRSLLLFTPVLQPPNCSHIAPKFRLVSHVLYEMEQADIKFRLHYDHRRGPKILLAEFPDILYSPSHGQYR